MRADYFERAAVHVACEFTDRADPSHFAVVGADNPILCLIILVSARDGVQIVFLDPFPICWMNAQNPLLVRFVDRARRKAMNMKIFGRTVTTKAVLQIDFKPANSPDTLDSGKL